MSTRVEIWTRQGEFLEITSEENATNETASEWLNLYAGTDKFGALNNENETLFIRGDAIAAIKFTRGERADGKNKI